MAKAITTLGHPPYCRDTYSSKFGDDWWELKEFLDKETQSFPYLLDMVATVKVTRTRMDRL